MLEKISSPSARIEEAMRKQNMKQRDVVNKTGISKASLSSYISGRYEPKQNALYKIGLALEVSEMWLAGYDVEMEKSIEQKKNDNLVKIIAELKDNEEFLEVVSQLYELSTEQINTMKSIISAISNKENAQR